MFVKLEKGVRAVYDHVIKHSTGSSGGNSGGPQDDEEYEDDDNVNGKWF